MKKLEVNELALAHFIFALTTFRGILCQNDTYATLATELLVWLRSNSNGGSFEKETFVTFVVGMQRLSTFLSTESKLICYSNQSSISTSIQFLNWMLADCEALLQEVDANV